MSRRKIEIDKASFLSKIESQLPAIENAVRMAIDGIGLERGLGETLRFTLDTRVMNSALASLPFLNENDRITPESIQKFITYIPFKIEVSGDRISTKWLTPKEMMEQMNTMVQKMNPERGRLHPPRSNLS